MDIFFAGFDGVVVVVEVEEEEEEEEEEGRKEGAVEEIERKEATRIVWRAACLAAYMVCCRVLF